MTVIGSNAPPFPLAAHPPAKGQRQIEIAGGQAGMQPLRLANLPAPQPVPQELKDSLARMWLLAQRPLGTPDNAPENIYAHVKVNGKVVATLYNSGGSSMSNEAAGRVGKLDDPYPGGPQLAKWRAEAYAKALGGTVEMAATAKEPHEWQPRVNTEPTYSRSELDAALKAMQEAARRGQSMLSPARLRLAV